MKMKSTFEQLVEIPTYATVVAMVTICNSALCRAMVARYWETRQLEDRDSRAAEVSDFFGITQAVNTSGYDVIERSASGKWFEAWTRFFELAQSAARSIEAGKALGQLMTPAMAAEFLASPSERDGEVTVADLDLPADLLAAFMEGDSKNSARIKALRGAAYAEVAIEAGQTFKQLRGHCDIDLMPHEGAILLRKFHERAGKALVNGLRTGIYGTKHRVDAARVSELVLTRETLRVAELEAQYLERGTEESDDAGHR